MPGELDLLRELVVVWWHFGCDAEELDQLEFVDVGGVGELVE